MSTALSASSPVTPLPRPAQDQSLSSVGYWEATLRPAASFWVVLVLLIPYECSVLTAAAQQGTAYRPGADGWLAAWISSACSALGTLPSAGGTTLLLHGVIPLLCLVLLGLPCLIGPHRWKLPKETATGIVAESLLFAFGLILIGQAFDAVADLSPESAALLPAWTREIAHFLGAGVYEELIFRSALIGGCLRCLPSSGRIRTFAVVAIVVLTSLIFSLAHYLPSSHSLPVGDGNAGMGLLQGFDLLSGAVEAIGSTPGLWPSFVFRAVAGVVFAALYLSRGLGIAVGTHAAYDVFVGVVLLTRL